MNLDRPFNKHRSTSGIMFVYRGIDCSKITNNGIWSVSHSRNATEQVKVILLKHTYHIIA